MVRLVCAASVGALFTSLTTTVKVLVAKNCFVLKAGPFVSDITVVNVLVLGPWDSLGVQVMTPEPEMLALVTCAPTPLVMNRLYVKVFAGRSGSVAELFTVMSANSLTVRSA